MLLGVLFCKFGVWVFLVLVWYVWVLFALVSIWVFGYLVILGFGYYDLSLCDFTLVWVVCLFGFCL